MEQSALVLTYSPQGAVWAWTPEHYEAKVEQPLMEADPFAADVLDFAHSLMSTANDVDLDGDCRFLYDTVGGGAGLLAGGIVSATGGGIMIWHSRKRSGNPRDGRASLGPGGIRGRF